MTRVISVKVTLFESLLIVVGGPVAGRLVADRVERTLFFVSPDCILKCSTGSDVLQPVLRSMGEDTPRVATLQGFFLDLGNVLGGKMCLSD